MKNFCPYALYSLADFNCEFASKYSILGTSKSNKIKVDTSLKNLLWFYYLKHCRATPCHHFTIGAFDHVKLHLVAPCTKAVSKKKFFAL